MHNYRSCDDPRIMADAIAAEVTRRQKQMNISLIQKIVNPELQHNITGTVGAECYVIWDWDNLLECSFHINFVFLFFHFLQFDSDIGCHRDTSILYLLLMFGTLWLALFLYNFRKTPYLTRSRREWLADYALPASVLIMSFLGAYTFSEIDSEQFCAFGMFVPFSIIVFPFCRGHVQNAPRNSTVSHTRILASVVASNSRVFSARLLPVLSLLHGPEHLFRHCEQRAEQAEERLRPAFGPLRCGHSQHVPLHCWSTMDAWRIAAFPIAFARIGGCGGASGTRPCA